MTVTDDYESLKVFQKTLSHIDNDQIHMCFDFDHYQCTDSVQLIRVNPNFWIICTVHSTVNPSKSKFLDYLHSTQHR